MFTISGWSGRSLQPPIHPIWTKNIFAKCVFFVHFGLHGYSTLRVKSQNLKGYNLVERHSYRILSSICLMLPKILHRRRSGVSLDSRVVFRPAVENQARFDEIRVFSRGVLWNGVYSWITCVCIGWNLWIHWYHWVLLCSASSRIPAPARKPTFHCFVPDIDESILFLFVPLHHQ